MSERPTSTPYCVLAVSIKDLHLDIAVLPVDEIEVKLVHRQGDVLRTGRWKGSKARYSFWLFDGDMYKVLELTEHLAEDPRIWSTIRDISFSLTVAYRGQCNLEFEPELMARLAKLDLTLEVTCYEDSDDEAT